MHLPSKKGREGAGTAWRTCKEGIIIGHGALQGRRWKMRFGLMSLCMLIALGVMLPAMPAHADSVFDPGRPDIYVVGGLIHYDVTTHQFTISDVSPSSAGWSMDLTQPDGSFLTDLGVLDPDPANLNYDNDKFTFNVTIVQTGLNAYSVSNASASALFNGFLGDNPNNTPVSVNLSAFSASPLFSFDFSTGSFLFNFNNSLVVDLHASDLTPSAIDDFTKSFTADFDGDVAAPVPLPGSLWAGSALLGGLALARLFRAKMAPSVI